MSENKTQPTSDDVDEFIARVKNPTRRADAAHLKNLLTRLTGEPATMWGPSIIGFGTESYRYETGREGTMPRMSFSPRSTSLVLYFNQAAEAHGDLLTAIGPHTTGKACVYIKKLADIDEDALVALITASLEAGPG